MWGPFITDEEACSVFEESPSLELLTNGARFPGKYFVDKKIKIKTQFGTLNSVLGPYTGHNR